MHTMEGRKLWSRLQEKMAERVLSFLPGPALCRCRSVCKAWNDLSRKPSFLDLSDLNRRNGGYLFITCFSIENSGWSQLDDGYRRRMCFLELDERRWYSIPVDDSLLAPTNRKYPRLLAADDGLICELSEIPSEHEKSCNLVLFDPVAKSRWELPVSKYDYGRVLPTLVTVVDNAAREFKVFFLDGPSPLPLSRRFFVFESSSGNWLELQGPPERLGVSVAGHLDGRDREDSAVFFQGNLYTFLGTIKV